MLLMLLIMLCWLIISLAMNDRRSNGSHIWSLFFLRFGTTFLLGISFFKDNRPGRLNHRQRLRIHIHPHLGMFRRLHRWFRRGVIQSQDAILLPQLFDAAERSGSSRRRRRSGRGGGDGAQRSRRRPWKGGGGVVGWTGSRSGDSGSCCCGCGSGRNITGGFAAGSDGSGVAG